MVVVVWQCVPASSAGVGCRAGRWLCHSWRYSLCHGCFLLPLTGKNPVWDLLFVSEHCKGERSVCQWLAYRGLLFLGEATRPLVWDAFAAETLPADRRHAGIWVLGAQYDCEELQKLSGKQC